jgi:hypothetical protein
MPNDGQQQSGFDVNAARQAGYSDDEILQHLTSTRNFDVAGALNAGYSKQDIIQHLSTTSAPQTAGQTPGASQITGISAQPAPSGWRDSVAKWAENVSNDLKYGTDTTGVGTLLKKMGAHGLDYGNSEEVGNFMGSLPLGLARATKGGAEITQQGKTWQGTKDVVGGTLQAATIPSTFMGGPAAETGAEAAVTAGGKLFGSAEHAGQLFDTVRAAAKDKPIELTDEVYDALKNIKQLADAGAKGTPRVASKLANRLNNVDEELYWDEARRFYSNISRLSANEYASMAPQMQRAVGQLGRALGGVLNDTAASVGKGEEYAQAMREYARSKSWQQFGAGAWDFIKKAAPYAVGIGAGGRMALSHVSNLADLIP